MQNCITAEQLSSRSISAVSSVGLGITEESWKKHMSPWSVSFSDATGAWRAAETKIWQFGDTHLSKSTGRLRPLTHSALIAWLWISHNSECLWCAVKCPPSALTWTQTKTWLCQGCTAQTLSQKSVQQPANKRKVFISCRMQWPFCTLNDSGSTCIHIYTDRILMHYETTHANAGRFHSLRLYVNCQMTAKDIYKKLNCPKQWETPIIHFL